MGRPASCGGYDSSGFRERGLGEGEDDDPNPDPEGGADDEEEYHGGYSGP